MATTNSPKLFKPIAVRCPHCGEIGDGSVQGLILDLGSGTLVCNQCDEEVTKQQLADAVVDINRLILMLDRIAEI